MNAIVIRNADGSIRCMGPHDGNYEPNVPQGCIRTIELHYDALIVDELARLQAVNAATQYRRDRVYPPIGDQLDDLFRQGAFSPEMAATLQAVKTAHPKGTP